MPRLPHRERSSQTVPSPPVSSGPAPLGPAARKIFLAGDRMNQDILRNLDPAAWQARLLPAGPGARTIAAIFTHTHNVRAKWIRLSAPHLGVPVLLSRSRCTPEQARAALADSAARCAEMLASLIDDPFGRFRRDGTVSAWAAGAEMAAYMLAHEAHHRGQVLMLAHQLGFALPRQIADGIWNWEKLWKECGFAGGPGKNS
jgi:uncharacterized damage-inducible protein DinB